jgi:hypothetical protein
MAENELELADAVGEAGASFKLGSVASSNLPRTSDKRPSQDAIARRNAGEALVEIARSYNVSHSTISRLAA